MLVYILGAPGSGKSAAVPHLRALLPRWVVLDWDALMEPASALAGREIRRAPNTWSNYSSLIHTVVDQILPSDVMLLGVCTPRELHDWPAGPWLLLDCSDDIRQRRLSDRGDKDDLADAMDDSHSYRRLGLRTVDTSHLTPAEVARAIVDGLDLGWSIQRRCHDDSA